MGRLASKGADRAEELTSFIVTVRDRDAIGSVALKLEALGIDVERVMKRTGVLGGRGPVRLLSKITALPGVKHAREERRYQLPPLHDSIPQ
ncbi:hypothetical protein [Blastomonas sp. CCH8-A3]|uniref:hypothetical protein n=1 Tax=Blastomonas sp. CCH8-A3 TaxID=1768743 RepID=UPI000826FB07|nr:hypothetical protein [Blastomonas sp. CCH8-A3]MBA4044710.1 hypothetical protein [Erythrobacter sp.]